MVSVGILRSLFAIALIRLRLHAMIQCWATQRQCLDTHSIPAPVVFKVIAGLFVFLAPVTQLETFIVCTRLWQLLSGWIPAGIVHQGVLCARRL